MERCRVETPKLAPVDAGREVACWLHNGGAQIPEELSLRDPAMVAS
jgi:hypothetical protein